MITREDIISCPEEYLSVINVRADECVFFDIETTGFKASSSHVYLVGAAYKSSRGWKRVQFLAQRPAEEGALLRTFAAFLKPFKVILSFNGNRFDIPYMTEKYLSFDLPVPFEKMRSVDIFTDVRVLRSFLCLEHMNQKSLEQFLQVGREDQYDGGKLIHVYKHYTASDDPESLRLLLLHNAEDVSGMLELIRLYGYLDALVETPRDIRVDTLGSVGTEPMQGISRLVRFCWPLRADVPLPVTRMNNSLQVTLDGSEGTITVPLLHGQLLYFFDNYKDYYFLPEENQAIHKSVAAYVDKSYRKQATRQTCYIRREGDYLPQPWEMFKPSMKRSYDDPITWFTLPDARTLREDPDMTQRYCRMILESCMHSR